MAQSATSAYETQEDKAAGAKAQFYVGFMRDTKSFASSDYSDGTHDNTEFTDSKLQLSAGQSSGSWTSAAIDSAHLTPNVIYDKITWTETLNGGSVSVEIRTATTSGGTATATEAAYASGTLDHTARYRYYQIVITLSEGASSPEVSALVVRHKALIPRDEYISLGSITYGIDIDFRDISAGQATITVANESNQWERRDSDSYIYGLEYFYSKLEIWAGFELADDTIEWFQQFLGEVESLEIGSGGSEVEAVITARDFIYRKLASTRIGVPTAAGVPQPYMSGKRYRVPCVETNTATHVFSFYCQQTITSIDATYTKASGSNQWDTVSPSSTSAANKTVTFATDPGADVAVDITVSATDHPADIIDDIIQNEISLDSGDWDTASITTTKSNSGSVAVGCSFDNITVLQAFRHLGIPIDATGYVENGVLKLKSFYPDVDESFSFSDSLIKSANLVYSIENLQNTVSVFYGDYEEDKTQFEEIQLSDSVTNYGEIRGQDVTFRYRDPVSMTSITNADAAVGHWLSREDEQIEIITIELPLEILRVELMDIVSITLSKHSLTAYKTMVYEKTLNLDDHSGTLKVLGFPVTAWMYWQDADPTEDLYYLVDDPTPAAQLDYRSYYY